MPSDGGVALLSALGCSVGLIEAAILFIANPQEPVAVFSVNDQSALDLDLRRSCRANWSWRLRSFALTCRRRHRVRSQKAASGSFELVLQSLAAPRPAAMDVSNATCGRSPLSREFTVSERPD